MGLIVGVGVFIYVYKQRLGLQYSLINVFICCLSGFGVFVHVSFIYMISEIHHMKSESVYQYDMQCDKLALFVYLFT